MASAILATLENAGVANARRRGAEGKGEVSVDVPGSSAGKLPSALRALRADAKKLAVAGFGLAAPSLDGVFRAVTAAMAREDAGGGAAGGFKDEDAFDEDDRSEYDDEEGGEGDEGAGDGDSSERRRSRHRGGKGFTQQWTKEEDDELVALIEKYGAKRWSYIASHMRRRRGKQCRDRYLNHLRPGIKTGEWSAEEEQILIEGHKALGTKWAALAKLLVGRPENAIKNHWHATLRCKTHKTRGEAPKISALKRYQMSLAPSAENGAAEEEGRALVVPGT